MDIQNKNFFPGQQPNERICLVFRQHWIVFGMKILVWVAFLVVYFAIDYLDLTYLPTVLDPSLLPLFHIFKIAYLMFLALGLFIVFVLYYLNVYIITNERIVDIEQESLLSHTVSELHLRKIQDVTAEVHGLLANIFDYGDVYIQTAGETERFVFKKIANPARVTKMILDLYEQVPDNEKFPQEEKTA